MLRKKYTIIILAVLLALALGYIAFDTYSEFKMGQDFSIFQQGAQFGYEQAITQVFQQALTCQQIPIYVENQTVNLIAVECLQLSDASENQ